MRLNSRRTWIALAVVVAAGAALLAFRGRDKEVQYQTTTVDRGDIVDVVGATGTLQAVTTVQVGSQVSGTVDSLGADFNSRVKKDQVVARLETSTFDARLSQARANLVAARANVEKAKSTVADTKQKYERAKELSAQQLLPEADLETAKSNYDGAVAALQGAVAAVSQSAASVQQAQVDLTHTVIRAPIDGVVVARNVDVGQTVAASLQAPVLFVIANDLSHMQVNASIDEADVGRVRTGEDVTFHVDAYPNETFTGRVEQVRLQPITVQNVVTYNTLIAVDNPGGRLMPGMTATVSVIVQRRDNVLRLPAAALRFRPEGWQPGGGRRAGAGASGAPPASMATGGAAATGGSPAAAVASGPEAAAGGGRGPRGGGGAGGGPGGAGRWAGRGAMGGAGWEGRGPGGPGAGGPGGGGRPAVVFVPGPDGKPKAQPIRTGINDGQWVEVVSGLDEGAPIITGTGDGAARAGGPRPGASAGTNPFAPQPQRRTRG
ncbi:MAG: efflux RND transporter periplasmic adaptor subunit [Acidobacteria bacterium]|nr:MAG: efflux RND transporter periplasmic adaptor subunit [Acidobacteriota bacterium]